MAWTAQGGGGNFEDPPVGTHLARCVAIIDLGTQKGEYMGEAKIRRETVIRWELPNAAMADGRPFVVLKFYTASLGEKANLRRDLVNWRGKEFNAEELMGFDEANLLDKCCMLSITQNDKGKVRVTGVMALPKGTTVPPRVNPLVYLSLTKDRYDASVFEALSDYFTGRIMLSPEWAELQAGQPKKLPPSNAPKTDDFDDDIPFILSNNYYNVSIPFDRRMRRARNGLH